MWKSEVNSFAGWFYLSKTCICMYSFECLRKKTNIFTHQNYWPSSKLMQPARTELRSRLYRRWSNATWTLTSRKGKTDPGQNGWCSFHFYPSKIQKWNDCLDGIVKKRRMGTTIPAHSVFHTCDWNIKLIRSQIRKSGPSEVQNDLISQAGCSRDLRVPWPGFWGCWLVGPSGLEFPYSDLFRTWTLLKKHPPC